MCGPILREYGTSNGAVRLVDFSNWPSELTWMCNNIAYCPFDIFEVERLVWGTSTALHQKERIVSLPGSSLCGLIVDSPGLFAYGQWIKK